MGQVTFTTITVDFGVASCLVPQAILELTVKSALPLTL